MRTFLCISILTLTLGCSTRKIKYDRNKILEQYSVAFIIFLDNEKIDLETVFLDKNNIENIQINKRTKELKINQLKQANFFDIQTSKSIRKNKIGLIVIDGVPFNESSIDKIKIDLNIIKSLTILKEGLIDKKEAQNLWTAYYH